jgi:hypothetical protein
MKGEKDHRLDAEVSDAQAQKSTEDGEDEAFCQRLSDESLARGAEGETDGDLCAPRNASCQEQIGYIGARDEEHQTADGEEDVQAVFVVGFHDAYASPCWNYANGLFRERCFDSRGPLGGHATFIDEPYPEEICKTCRQCVWSGAGAKTSDDA